MSDQGVLFRGVDTQKFDDQNLGLGKDQRRMGTKFKSFFANTLPLLLGLGFLFVAFKSDTMMEISLLFSLMFFMGWSRKRRAFYSYQNSLMDKPKYFGYKKEAMAYDFSPKEGIKDSVGIIEKTNPQLLKDAGLKGIAKKLGGQGKAVFFFGHEVNTGQEAHLTDDKARTHIVLFGTTGAGKTETILSMCVNFLVMSSSFILVDGKGDQLLFGKVFALCRAFDRLEDLSLIHI